MTSHDAAVHDGGTDRRSPARCRSTPAWRTRPGCTTTCWAAIRTTSPPSGRRSRQCSRSSRKCFRHPGNRAFLGRLDRYWRGCADPAVPRHRHRISTAGNTHEVVQAIAPSPVSCTWTTTRSSGPCPRTAHQRKPGSTEYIDADLRHTPGPDRAAWLLDFTRPVAVTLLSILHAGHLRRRPVCDRGHADGCCPARAVTSLSPTGHRILSTRNPRTACRTSGAGWSSSRLRSAAGSRWRSSSQAQDLVAPGLVRVEEWRPEPGTGDTGRSSLWCAAGCKR